MRTGIGRWLSCGLLLIVAAAWPQPAPAEVKNVILMISDGAGFNTWDATSMYQGRWDPAKRRSTQVYDGPGWVKLGCSTYPLTTSKKPTQTAQQEPGLVYNPSKAWDGQDGYRWLRAAATDSAAAATALATGLKTYDNAINWSDLDRPIRPTIAEAAKARGRSTGVVTTVPWSHATPAGLGVAHNRERDNYVEIANEMLTSGQLDVIMGAGNPEYDNNGMPKKNEPRKEAAKPAKSDEATSGEKQYKYVGGPETWKAIEAARSRPGATYQGFRPVSTKAEFEALLQDPPPAKVVGTAQAGTTLQQARSGLLGHTEDPAQDRPLNKGMPTLALMTKGALNVLGKNPKGLYLMIEGGAVDWANHANQAGRMVQEQADFVAAVEAVVQWVQQHSNWDETLLILTADHETGLIWGPNSEQVPFDPIVDHGAGKMPGLKYHSRKHSNSLVPLYAKGAQSQLLAGQAAGTDPKRGPYVDNTQVARTMFAAIGAASPADRPSATTPRAGTKRPGKGRDRDRSRQRLAP